MLKVTIHGECYPFDDEHYPVSEGVALEEGLGMDFSDWQRKLRTGSAKALCGFAFLVLKRNERNVPLADILSGKFPMNTDDISIDGDEEADPTTPGSPPDTGSGSEPSASSTTTPPSRSEPSASSSSTT